MAKVFIQESTLTAIGDAIRNKTGKTALINPTNMPTEIASIESGSSEPNLQQRSISITTNGTYPVRPSTGYDGLSLVNITVQVAGGGSSEIVYGDWQDIEEETVEDEYGMIMWANPSAMEDNIYLIGNVAGVKHIKFKYNHMMNGTVTTMGFAVPNSNPNGTNATFYFGILDLGMAYLHLYLDGNTFNLYAKDPEKSCALLPAGGALISHLQYAVA